MQEKFPKDLSSLFFQANYFPDELNIESPISKLNANTIWGALRGTENSY